MVERKESRLKICEKLLVRYEKKEKTPGNKGRRIVLKKASDGTIIRELQFIQ
ncbi:hypothetical protein KJ693_01490 [bacterium]|nr:hypothetical protein [bacterium]MBU1613964.1 hypothetical protein [bacterium]